MLGDLNERLLPFAFADCSSLSGFWQAAALHCECPIPLEPRVLQNDLISYKNTQKIGLGNRRQNTPEIARELAPASAEGLCNTQNISPCLSSTLRPSPPMQPGVPKIALAWLHLGAPSPGWNRPTSWVLGFHFPTPQLTCVLFFQSCSCCRDPIFAAGEGEN